MTTDNKESDPDNINLDQSYLTNQNMIQALVKRSR